MGQMWSLVETPMCSANCASKRLDYPGKSGYSDVCPYFVPFLRLYMEIQFVSITLSKNVNKESFVSAPHGHIQAA